MMTEFEQYKRAYATLVGRIDTIISALERVNKNFVVEGAALAFTSEALTNALREAEDVFLGESPEE